MINRQIMIILVLIAATLSGCNKTISKEDFIIKEKDLIPESLCVDSRTGITYVGSTYKRKIIQITPDGNVTDFFPQETNGIWSLVGMTLDEKNNILWANTAHANEVMPLINPDTSRDWMTNVTAFDIRHKRIIQKYALNESKAFLNDLTLIPNGDLYVTETVNNKIYKIDKDDDELKLFLEPSGFTFLNGITYSEKLNTLFVSSQQGIISIDLKTKKYHLLKTNENINAKSIDGLTLYNDYFIGHQSTKVSKFYMNNEGTLITKSEILDTGKEFDSSTNGDVANGYYYFIVNSQISSGADYERRTIKPVDSLENVIIRKIKL